MTIPMWLSFLAGAAAMFVLEVMFSAWEARRQREKEWKVERARRRLVLVTSRLNDFPWN